MINLDLNEQDVALIMKCLEEQPLKLTRSTYAKIEMQAKAYMDAKEKPADGKKEK